MSRPAFPMPVELRHQYCHSDQHPQMSGLLLKAGHCLHAGVVAVETAATTLSIPADPGAPDTSERSIAQSGQANSLDWHSIICSYFSFSIPVSWCLITLHCKLCNLHVSAQSLVWHRSGIPTAPSRQHMPLRSLIRRDCPLLSWQTGVASVVASVTSLRECCR